MKQVIFAIISLLTISPASAQDGNGPTFTPTLELGSNGKIGSGTGPKPGLGNQGSSIPEMQCRLVERYPVDNREHLVVHQAGFHYLTPNGGAVVKANIAVEISTRLSFEDLLDVTECIVFQNRSTFLVSLLKPREAKSDRSNGDSQGPLTTTQPMTPQPVYLHILNQDEGKTWQEIALESLYFGLGDEARQSLIILQK